MSPKIMQSLLAITVILLGFRFFFVVLEEFVLKLDVSLYDTIGTILTVITFIFASATAALLLIDAWKKE